MDSDKAPSDLNARPGAPHERGRSLRNAAYLTALAGIVHALLFLLSAWILSGVPGARSTSLQIQTFYESSDSRRLILVGLYLMPFAGIAFLWFIVALRMWLEGSADRLHALFSNMQLVSGIIFVTLFLAGAASQSVIAASVEFSEAPIDPDMARQFPQFGNTLLLVFAMRMAAIFVLATSNLGRHAGILPRWFTIAGFGVGIFLLLSATFSPFLVLAFPAWTLTLCVLLILRARRIPADVVVGSRLPPGERSEISALQHSTRN